MKNKIRPHPNIQYITVDLPVILMNEGAVSGKNEHPEKPERPDQKPPFWKSCLEPLLGMGRGLFSPDRPTRRMSVFFFLSFFGFFFVLIFGLIQFQRIRKTHSEKDAATQLAMHRHDHLKRQEEQADYKASQVSLGIFMVELTPANQVRPTRSLMNLAEIEIFADCDSRDTKEYIEAHLVQARGNVSALFLAVDRKELMSPEGKRRFKKMVLERLNLWLPKGSTVREVFITKLILN